MIVLDTDVHSIVQRKEGAAYGQLAHRLDASSESVYVTIVSVEEQMRGWLALLAKARTAERQIIAYLKLHRFVDTLPARPILDFDDHSASILSQLRKSRIRIGTMDLRIAAIAIANDALLISRNLTDFAKVPGLRVEDWTVGA